MGYEVKFEHIKVKTNVLANILSRKLTGILQEKSIKTEEILLCEDYPQNIKKGLIKQTMTKHSINDYWKHILNEFENSKNQLTFLLQQKDGFFKQKDWFTR